MAEKNEWPDSELPKTFDWSLSMNQIEKIYGPAPLKRVVPPIKVNDRGQTTTSATATEEFIKKVRNKFPYAFILIESADPDMPRWIYENLIAKPI